MRKVIGAVFVTIIMTTALVATLAYVIHLHHDREMQQGASIEALDAAVEALTVKTSEEFAALYSNDQVLMKMIAEHEKGDSAKEAEAEAEDAQ